MMRFLNLFNPFSRLRAASRWNLISPLLLTLGLLLTACGNVPQFGLTNSDSPNERLVINEVFPDDAAGEVTARYLLHDRDRKFVPGFHAVFRSEGVEVVRTPYRVPTAHAIAERWVGSVRRECLDHLLLVNERHLRRVLAAYVAHDNQARPHQGLEQRTPLPSTEPAGQGAIKRRERLGGLLREYYREAA